MTPKLNIPYDPHIIRHCLGCWPKRVAKDVRDVDYIRSGEAIVRTRLCAECRRGVVVVKDRGDVNERSDDDET